MGTGTNCETQLSSGACATLGGILPFLHQIHEIDKHGGDRCTKARIEIVALVAHMLHIRPSELGLVKERMMHHLRTGCQCGDGREFEV